MPAEAARLRAVHDSSNAAIAVLTLGRPLDAAFPWVLIDLGFGVLTFESVEDVLSAVEEDLVELVLIDSSAGADEWQTAADHVHSVAGAIPVVALAPAPRPPPAGIEVVLAPPYGESAATTLRGIIERAHGHPISPGG